MDNKSDESLYRVRIYKDNRMTIFLHEFNPTPMVGPKLPYRNRSTPTLIDVYMTCSDYIKALKRHHRKLWEKDFVEDKCMFATLTLQEDLTYEKLLNEYHRFVVYFTRKFGKFEYFRTIELHEKIPRFHIHLILEFKDNVATITQSDIERLWGLGQCYLEPIDDIRGLIQYLTKFKEQHKQKDNPHFTCFHKGARVLSMSYNFGTPIGQDSFRDCYITHEQMVGLVQHHNDLFFDNNGPFVRIDSHEYYDYVDKEVYRYWDRVYIRATKDSSGKDLTFLLDKNKPP